MRLSPETVTKDRVSQVISIIILIFNQQTKISYSLEKIKQAVESVFNSYELIVVNDCSIDNTLTILKGIASMGPHIRILSYTANRGKGYAVGRGVLQSHGGAVIFLDGNLDISLDSIKDYYVEKLSASDLVIASKRHPKSSVIIPKSRAFLSRASNLLIKMATGIIPQKDIQAWFKVGNGEIMHTIFRGVTVNCYAFNVELFTIASIVHLKVQEMAIIMKIDWQFNTKEDCEYVRGCNIRICYRHRVLHAYQKELAVHLPVTLENNGVNINKMVLQHSEVLLTLHSV